MHGKKVERAQRKTAGTGTGTETADRDKISLRHTFINDCWDKDYQYMLESSLIDSSEHYSHEDPGINAEEIVACFDILGYDQIIVIGTYRRYADWIGSAYHEHMKLSLYKYGHPMATETCPTIWKYLWNFHVRKKNYNGRRGWYRNLDITLTNARKNGPSRTEIKVLNYFQLPNESFYNTITTELYCDALGMELTPNTCNYSRQRELERGRGGVNKGSQGNVVYEHIVKTALKLELISPTTEEKARFECDLDGDFWCESKHKCMAKDTKSKTKRKCRKRNIIQDERTQNSNMTDMSTINTWQKLAQYHTETLGMNWKQNLPLLCPPREELEVLLNKSLAFEELILPEFYNTPLGKDEHIRLFWDNWVKQKKTYCWVDTDRLFQDATSWVQILHDRMVINTW